MRRHADAVDDDDERHFQLPRQAGGAVVETPAPPPREQFVRSTPRSTAPELH